MSTQILLVGHGSRESSGNHDIHEFVQLWRQRHPAWRIQTCFIEFAEPSLAHGLDSAALEASRSSVARVRDWRASSVKSASVSFWRSAAAASMRVAITAGPSLALR